MMQHDDLLACTLPGSGLLASPEAHSFWLGQPAHPFALPACSDSGPIQPGAGSKDGISFSQW